MSAAPPLDPVRPELAAAAARAIALVGDGARVGLGSGRAASVFIGQLGVRRREGLDVSGVATSEPSATLARREGIPLIPLGEGGMLDLTVDGADEVAPDLDLVKGWGGALVRERIVAAASRRQVILVGEEKLVRSLGERGRIPVEVIPAAEWLAMREIRALGLSPSRRSIGGASAPYITANGNILIDCALTVPLANGAGARALEAALLAIAGVVDTGLFLGTAERVIVGYRDGRVDERSRSAP